MLPTRGLIIGSIFLFFFATHAIGATYHVAPYGSDSNPGTQAQPWAHPQKCADMMVGGDTCIVKDGTYNDHDGDSHVVDMKTFSGAGPTNWVTFRAENTHGAVIDGENASSAGRGFMMRDSDYVRIIGFEIKRVYTGIRFYDNAHDIHIENCKIHDIGRHWLSPSDPCPKTATKSFSGIGARGDCWNITVNRNEIYDIGRMIHDPPDTCWRDFLWDHAIYASGSNWLITNNLIYNVFSGWNIKISGYMNEDPRPTAIVVNNTFANNRNQVVYKADCQGMILITDKSGTYNPYIPHDVIIENNLFYNNTGDMAVHVNYRVDLEGSSFQNNVMSCPYVWGTFGGTYTGGLPTTGKNKKSLPLSSLGMKDPKNYDFSLTSSASYVIDTGKATKFVDQDYNNNPRPQNSLYDIGAYEYYPQSFISSKPKNLKVVDP